MTQKAVYMTRTDTTICTVTVVSACDAIAQQKQTIGISLSIKSIEDLY